MFNRKRKDNLPFDEMEDHLAATGRELSDKLKQLQEEQS